MPAATTEADFAALVRRAGLTLTPSQQAVIHAVWPKVEAMQAMIRTPLPGTPAPAQPRVITTEPATTFRPDGAR
jgi:hypothetical protein